MAGLWNWIISLHRSKNVGNVMNTAICYTNLKYAIPSSLILLPSHKLFKKDIAFKKIEEDTCCILYIASIKMTIYNFSWPLHGTQTFERDESNLVEGSSTTTKAQYCSWAETLKSTDVVILNKILDIWEPQVDFF